MNRKQIAQKEIDFELVEIFDMTEISMFSEIYDEEWILRENSRIGYEIKNEGFIIGFGPDELNRGLEEERAMRDFDYDDFDAEEFNRGLEEFFDMLEEKAPGESLRMLERIREERKTPDWVKYAACPEILEGNWREKFEANERACAMQDSDAMDELFIGDGPWDDCDLDF